MRGQDSYINNDTTINCSNYCNTRHSRKSSNTRNCNNSRNISNTVSTRNNTDRNQKVANALTVVTMQLSKLLTKLIIQMHLSNKIFWAKDINIIGQWESALIYREKSYDTWVLSQLDQWSSTNKIKSFDFIGSTLAFCINTFVRLALEI